MNANGNGVRQTHPIDDTAVLAGLEFTPRCRSRVHDRPAAFYVTAHGCVEGLACTECVAYWLRQADAFFAAKGRVFCRDCQRPFERAGDFYTRVIPL